MHWRSYCLERQHLYWIAAYWPRQYKQTHTHTCCRRWQWHWQWWWQQCLKGHITHKMEAKSENVLYVYVCRLFGPIPPSDPYSETRPLITHYRPLQDQTNHSCGNSVAIWFCSLNNDNHKPAQNIFRNLQFISTSLCVKLNICWRQATRPRIFHKLKKFEPIFSCLVVGQNF